MATLNGKFADFNGKSLNEIGHMILNASPQRDGVGIDLGLSSLEVRAFEELEGPNIGNTINKMIDVALADESMPCRHSYKYDSQDRHFVTNALGKD